MRKFFCFFLFFLQIGYAQNSKSIALNWDYGSYSVADDNFVTIPYVKGGKMVFNDKLKSISYVDNINLVSPINSASVVVSNVEYESVPATKLGGLNPQSISSGLNFKLYSTKARDKFIGVVSFNLIVKDGNGYKKVKNISYSFNEGSSNVSENRNVNTIASSVLKTGVWKKFYVTNSGVYKISKAFLLGLGFNVNVNPQTIKIYGNGGRMVPLLNSVPYPKDLEENAILFSGEEDGVFNDSDYIMFYAEGVDNWNDDSNTYNNLYSNKSYYYVTSNAAPSKRISAIVEPTSSPATIHTSFDDQRHYEVDKNNIGKLGRKWFGDSFSVNDVQTFLFNFPNKVPGENIGIKINAGAKSAVTTSLNVKVNSQDLGDISFSPMSGGTVLGSENELNASLPSTSNNFSVVLKYNNGGVPSSNGYLDYIRLTTKSALKGFGKQFRFTVDDNINNLGVCQYQFSSASNISQVWDITDIYNVSSISNTNNANFSFKANMGEVRKYIAIDKSDLFTPIYDTDATVYNQDIKGTIFNDANNTFKDIDYLIVTPYWLKTQADKLANFHRTKSGLNVKVVTLTGIYNEFSSGKQDIGAIRNLVKYVYDNASDDSKRLKYLCLFGDASFDFKDRIKNNTNVVPIFHSLYSFSVASSYISDDYFVLMDSDEGDMDAGFKGLDIAVGRVLASSVVQAEQMVAKIIDYHNEKSYGKWRNNITMISDDADRDSDASLQVDVDQLSDAIYAQKPFLNVKKIHSDSYVQETTSGGQKYPKVRENFVNSFSQGTLVVNYFGHGGEDGLAGERIFEKSDAITLYNKYKYPLFITVTCEFTKFDDPTRLTAGEFVYWNASGGAIGMVTTTRQIGQFTGSQFNLALASNLYSYGSDQYPTIAEAVRLTKNMNTSTGNYVIFYLGDPALKLAIPKPKIVLTKINDVPVSGTTDLLKALSFVKLSGEVVDESNAVISNYNGELSVSVFDKEIDRVTLGNDGTVVGTGVFIMDFKTLGETIFRGNASVTNGQFEFGFIVPRDIKIAEGNGRVSFYAKKNAVLEDQTGYDLSIKVGGVNVNAEADTKPPRVRIYMNDETFASGGITSQNPLFLAFLEDEHGINTASGIGHDIVAYLDGDETKPYVLNDFYETELNDYTKGKLKFPFKNLAIGLHTLTFKAWDVYNNPITAQLQFIVVGDETLTLSNVLNYPNPFVNHTEFWFTHNKPFEPLDVQVQVLTITGKVVWSKNQTITTAGFTSRDITWDGRDDFGDKIGKGVYVYKLTVRSTLTNKKTEKYEKLVIL
ncbi:type IX secretion system sortase PorU [Flavobacterium amnicola]|uniref:Type IX secretion system sortase PorU n=1 Tax=Flavobacterium amnicola TaxID=2506422 RepID=A0A4V1N1T6_9FLAO|nr:type IX secretion system sortase PorU [Flavobacterium amnicola]RXR17885.1 type IX secretion system sortase PorU [Flavobacterium amnicola]